MSYKRSKSDCSEGGGRGGGRVWEGERLVNFLALNKSHDNSISHSSDLHFTRG